MRTAATKLAQLSLAIILLLSLGCERKNSIIEPPPGSKVLTQEELDAANAARTAAMSGAAAEMSGAAAEMSKTP